MKFNSLAASMALFGASSSSPVAAQEPSTFELMSLLTGSPIHFSRVSAAHSGLFLNFPDQNASCTSTSDGYATFYIQDEELFLYTPASKNKQKVFTDRSGMGQGVTGYVPGDSRGPRYGEFKGWNVDGDGNLMFKGQGLLGCPNSIQGAWSIWVAGGVNQPGGNKDCRGFTARTLPIAKPVSCEYTQG